MLCESDLPNMSSFSISHLSQQPTTIKHGYPHIHPLPPSVHIHVYCMSYVQWFYQKCVYASTKYYTLFVFWMTTTMRTSINKIEVLLLEGSCWDECEKIRKKERKWQCEERHVWFEYAIMKVKRDEDVSCSHQTRCVVVVVAEVNERWCFFQKKEQ